MSAICTKMSFELSAPFGHDSELSLKNKADYCFVEFSVGLPPYPAVFLREKAVSPGMQRGTIYTKGVGVRFREGLCLSREPILQKTFRVG